MSTIADRVIAAGVLDSPIRITAEMLVERARRAEELGEWDDAERLYKEALERIEAGETPELGPRVMRWLGRVHFERGEYDRANGILEASLIAAQKLNRRQDAASALNSIAIVAQLRGTLDVAEALYARAGEVAEEIGDEQLCAITDQNLGVLANIRGDLQTALVRYQSALDRFNRMKDHRGAGKVLNNIGMLHVDVGEWAAAELSFNGAYELAERIGDPATMGKVENNRAELYLKRQQFERARECCERSFRLFTRLGSDSGLGSVHRYYGVLYRETGKPDMAHVHFSLALKLARTCDNPLLEAETENERAQLYLNERLHRQAIRSLNRAHRLFCELDARREILDLRRRLNRMEDIYLRAVQMWAEDAPDMADVSGGSRGRRVAEYAVLLGKAVGYQDLHWLRIGAYMHDVGNSGLPSDILRKQGKLNAEEWEIVQSHTTIGSDIVSELEFPGDVKPMVRNHHEHWDGTGYPDQLKDTQIPVAARIICIADAFDALTTDRSFRPPFTVHEAIRIMRSEAGRIFDPGMFGVFEKLIAENPRSISPRDDDLRAFV